MKIFSYDKPNRAVAAIVFLCFLVPITMVGLVGCGDNCDSKTCSVHGHLNRPTPPEYRFERGDFVEHIIHGKAIIKSVDDPGLETNWPIYTIRTGDTCFDVWEHELKPLNIEGYQSPSSEEPIGLEKDLELQMMEERIEKRVMEKLKHDRMGDNPVNDLEVEK